MKFANFISSLLDLAPRDASGNIVLQGATAEQRLNVEELAIFSTIDLIASAASLCEWRTYQAGERKKGEDWYSFNVEPNPNQNAAEFKRLLVARLLRFNEALVFERGGALYLADSFTRTEYAFRPCVYTGVTCNNLTLSYTLTEPDVFYFRLANQDAAALLADLRGLYSEAMKAALDKYKKSGDPGRVFPNLLSAELNIDGPLQCIVSDMTAFYVKGIYYELTLYMDLWNNEIVSHALSAKRGDRMTYISGLADLLELKKEHPEYQMILHSDQGSVYASKAFNDLLPVYVSRSMSRAGTPTDNAAMESINGWIKAELFMDFHVTGEKPVEQEIDEYIVFFNEQRPAYSLNYLTPKQYREAHAA